MPPTPRSTARRARPEIVSLRARVGLHLGLRRRPGRMGAVPVVVAGDVQVIVLTCHERAFADLAASRPRLAVGRPRVADVGGEEPVRHPSARAAAARRPTTSLRASRRRPRRFSGSARKA